MSIAWGFVLAGESTSVPRSVPVRLARNAFLSVPSTMWSVLVAVSAKMPVGFELKADVSIDRRKGKCEGGVREMRRVRVVSERFRETPATRFRARSLSLIVAVFIGSFHDRTWPSVVV